MTIKEKARVHEPTERDFILAISKNPSDSKGYLDYIIFLEKFCVGKMWPEKEEESRKLSFLKAQLEGDVATMQKHAEYLNPNWLAVVSNVDIVNCGRNDPEYRKEMENWWESSQDWHPELTLDEYLANHPRFRMDFVCDKKWDQMAPTENSKVRFCGDCLKNVYFCEDIIEARELGNQGCCVGIDMGIRRKEHDLVGELSMFGRPSPEHVEENKNRHLPDRVSAKRIMKKASVHMKGKSVAEDWTNKGLYND